MRTRFLDEDSLACEIVSSKKDLIVLLGVLVPATTNDRYAPGGTGNEKGVRNLVVLLTADGFQQE
jgi:hypothetical protein